jgi:predicted enzyme related to lactoylglutathione lyase
MPNPVVHFEIIAPDGGAAQKFYADLFGWKVDVDPQMHYGSVEAQDGKGIGGGIAAVMAENTPGYVSVYVEVDDPQKYLDKVVSMGGKVIMPVTEIPNVVTFAQFADPQGLMVGLIKSGSM